MVLDSPAGYRRILDSLGFAKTELVLSEWHHADFDWTRYDRDRDYHYVVDDTIMNNVDSAVFIPEVLCGLQDTPVDLATYYSATTFEWGFFNRKVKPNKCYYGMLAFSRLAQYPDRLPVQADKYGNVKVLAGRKADGACAVLVSCFKSKVREVSIDFKGRKLTKATCSVCILDATRNLEPLEDLEISGSILKLKKAAGSVAFLIELQPNL